MITTERMGRILIARLDNPPHALMTDQMVGELDDLVRRVDADDEIGVVIITGAHPGQFLAHFDVRELLAAAEQAPRLSQRQASAVIKTVRKGASLPGVGALLQHGPASGLAQLERFHDTLLRMGRSGTIFVAAINGSTAGGGLELALACDLRYLADDAELAQPEILIGIPPGGGGTQRLSRLIGRAKALELMLTGRPVSAEEAAGLGLVTALFGRDELLSKVIELAQPLTRRYKPTVGVIKRAVLDGGSLPLEEGIHLEKSGLVAMFGETPVRRAMAAYVDYLDTHDELAGEDPAGRQQLLDGTFSPFYPQ